MYLFLEKRTTYFVWLPSDLESALKIGLETVKQNTLYTKTRWAIYRNRTTINFD